MNKRQHKKQERKQTGTQPPWAGGRFSQPVDQAEEVFVVYVACPQAGTAERQVCEEHVVPYSSGVTLVLSHCREMVDRFLADVHRPGMSPDELFSRYRQEGPDPYVRYEERGVSEYSTNSKAVFFNAWGYAETACRQLCGEQPGEPSRSLALWQGRYHEFDRKRMMSQLLLHRRVRLIRGCVGSIGIFPAGAEGTIGMHVYYVDSSCFNWANELPVILEVADERGQVTFGIPYDAMEFVESDGAYLARLMSFRTP